jgi:hypothetical protein
MYPKVDNDKVVIDLYDSVSGADIILKTSDGMYFQTFKILLSTASEVFSQMFTLPQNAGVRPPGSFPLSLTEETIDGLSVIEMSEPESIISAILTFNHPGFRHHNLRNLEDVLALAAALKKYEMHAALLDLSKSFKDDYIQNEADALTCFCVAWRHGLLDEVCVAARYLLYTPLEARPEVPAMQNISGLALHRLQKHYVQCTAAIGEFIDEPSQAWRTSKNRNACWITCRSCPPTTRGVTFDKGVFPGVSTWFYMFSEGMKTAVKQKQPLDNIMISFSTASALSYLEKTCSRTGPGSCKEKAAQDLRVFMKDFEEAFNQEITKVSLIVSN